MQCRAMLHVLVLDHMVPAWCRAYCSVVAAPSMGPSCRVLQCALSSKREQVCRSAGLQPGQVCGLAGDSLPVTLSLSSEYRPPLTVG